MSFTRRRFPREKLPKEIYLVFDANDLPYVFFDFEKCPVHFRPGVGIDVAVYKISTTKVLDVEFKFEGG
jgi:hypothetical protein